MTQALPVTVTLAMPKTVAIVQSNYIPWKGYFDLIRSVDEFILFDDVQYTHHDWRNRNRIKTRQGTQWLTVPVNVSGKFGQKIKDALVSKQSWAKKHWATLVQNYSRAAYFSAYSQVFEALYLECEEVYLSRINQQFIVAICSVLGIRTKIVTSADYELIEGKTARLVSLCQQASATEYLSGPAAREYLDEDQFREAGISLRYVDYSDYPEYPQLHPPFDHFVTVLDLIFNTGSDALKHMKRL